MTQAPNTLTDAERAAGWQLLFDGKTTAGWHGYGKRPFPDGWQVVDGALSRVARGGDIVTDRSFANFELSLEWMVAKAGNSGIFYRGIEADDWRQTPIFHSAPEMQVLDDAGHADGKSPLTSAGSLYGLYPAPPGIVRPAGQWNQVRIVARGSMVEHWLNGTKVVEFDTRSSDFAARVKSSKFAGWPAFATATAGVIGLQDHGDLVRYRSIKIRPL
ncbi:MAG: DUF1080 domain-containing protein [Gemmatimonadetes bacterium]|nr:DUF1080 domain-containing protein [Gemmatimonadota bacterium]